MHYYLPIAMKSTQNGTKRLNAKLLMEVCAVICIKVACLTLIWFAFFNSGTRMDQTPQAVSDGLLYRSTQLNH